MVARRGRNRPRSPSGADRDSHFRYPLGEDTRAGGAAPVPSQSQRSGVDPRQEYTQRRGDRQEQAARQSRRERLVGNARVVVFLAGLVAGYFALATPRLNPLWLVPFALGFGALLFLRESVARAWHRAARAGG